MMEHYLICDSSHGATKSCSYIDCPYHLEHYDPKPEDWVIIHAINCINSGGCMKNMQKEMGKYE